jgi:hypothetical protein
MSLGYAEKLSYIEDVGNVGMTEHFDPSHVLLEKVSLFFLHSLVHVSLSSSLHCSLPFFMDDDFFLFHLQLFFCLSYMLICCMN